MKTIPIIFKQQCMKRSFLILVVGLMFSVSVQAQKTHKKKAVAQVSLIVPDNVKASFANEFATVADNKWSKNYSGNYVANFTNADNLKEVVEYNRAGNIIKSKTFYDETIMPKTVKNALMKSYADAKVNEVAKVDILGVTAYYSVSVTTNKNSNKQFLVSEEGTVSE
jgi:hypothetical protein